MEREKWTRLVVVKVMMMKGGQKREDWAGGGLGRGSGGSGRWERARKPEVVLRR
jgi:hypothetical protein